MGSNTSKSNKKNTVEAVNKAALTDNTISTLDFARKQAQAIKEKYDKKIESWITFIKNEITTEAKQGGTEFTYEKTSYNVFSDEWFYLETKMFKEHDIAVRRHNYHRTFIWTNSSKGFGKEVREIASNAQETRYQNIIARINDVIEKHACFEFEFPIYKNYKTVMDRLEADGFTVQSLGSRFHHDRMRLSWERPCENTQLLAQDMHDKTHIRLKNLDKAQIIQSEINDLYPSIQALAQKKETFNSDKIIAGQDWISVLDLETYSKDLHSQKSLGRLFIKEIAEQFVKEHPIIETFKVKLIPNDCIALSWE